MIELFRYIEQAFVLPATEDNSINVELASDFQEKIRQERNHPSGDQLIRNTSEEFIHSNFKDGKSPVMIEKKLLDFRRELLELKDPDMDKIKNLIRSGFDQKVKELVNSEPFTKGKRILFDSIVAIKLTTSFDKVNASRLVTACQVVAFIELIAQDKPNEITADLVKSMLQRPIQIPASFFPVKKQADPQTHPAPDDSANERERIAALQKQAIGLKATYETLMKASGDVLEMGTVTRDSPERIRDRRAGDREEERPSLREPPPPTFLKLSIEGFDKLDSDVKNVLVNTGIDPTTTSLPTMVSRVKEKWISTAGVLQPHLVPAAPKVYQLGMHTFAIQPVPKIETPSIAMPDFSHAITRPVGIGNLQVVRQELLGYEAGEISHIENVLEGELYKRSYARTESSELTTTDETETTQSEERDLQSTDRNEMVSESQKESSRTTVASQGQNSATDYGKLVENSKTNYARSVTDRAVSNLTERVKQLRVRREQKTFTEKTGHQIDNTEGKKNVRGIYQWVDKKYKNRIMNYGKRLMYDVVLPEPAAFLIESLENAEQPESFKLTKPIEPWFTPTSLDASNYVDYATRYGVTGTVEPPPDEFVETVAHPESPADVTKKTDAFGVKINTDFFTAFSIEIPKGYKAVSGYIQSVNVNRIQVPLPAVNELFFIDTGVRRDFEFFIGEHYFFRFSPSDIPYLSKSFTMNGETGTLPVTLRTFNRIVQFNFAIGINCIRTSKGMEAWQLKTHAAILQGYRRQLAEYEDKLSKHQNMVRTQMLLAKNYARNPAVETTELKRLFIHLLVSEHLPSVGVPPPLSSRYFFLTDPKYVKKWGSIVAFFERAFEWENMMYFYYPYFYGRITQWGKLILIQDLDPQFEEFLKAGAARVVVPVRPGFEGAMAHYHETGDVWMGEEMPDMFSDMYVSIIEEIKSRNYAPGEEKCVAEWDAKLPTTLVMLKEDEKLPAWTSTVVCKPVQE